MAADVTVTVHRPGEDPVGFETAQGAMLLDVLREHGIDGVRAPCAGAGTCGKCLVRNTTEDGEPRLTLACRSAVRRSGEVWLDAPLELEVQTDFRRPPGMTVTATRSRVRGYRIAVDVGTTTIAAALIAPGQGAVVASVSDRNRQAPYGSDVISRITQAEVHGLAELSGVLRTQLADLATYLLECAGVEPSEVEQYVIAGNTVMEHFVDEISPAGIGVAPFTPASHFGDLRPASRLGLPGQPDAEVYLAPAISGYVGGDITAGILACGLTTTTETVFLLDLGTNGEIALATPSGIATCATAAGPAFEGAQIECGLPAVAGAINRVTVAAGQLRNSTILDALPTGICGSGLVDALAAALRLGLVDDTGKLRTREEVRPALAQYLSPADEPPRLILTDDGSVYLTQKDIRQLQLAKGAIAAGMDVMLAEFGLSIDDVDRVLLAGGFGTRVRSRSLATIGMIPGALADRVTAVGNAALAGALDLARDPASSRRAGAMATGVKYLELSLDPRFTTAFVERIGFELEACTSLTQAVQLAGEVGFEAVARLDPATLVPNPQVRVMCAADRCHSYGRNWCCPPACGTIEELTAPMRTFSSGLLLQSVGQLEDNFDLDTMSATERVHKARLRRLTGELGPGFPRAYALGTGACDLCTTCTYPAQACKLPGLATVSMEAAGLLVSDVCEANGAAYYHGPLTVTFTSCVLLE